MSVGFHISGPSVGTIDLNSVRDVPSGRESVYSFALADSIAGDDQGRMDSDRAVAGFGENHNTQRTLSKQFKSLSDIQGLALDNFFLQHGRTQSQFQYKLAFHEGLQRRQNSMWNLHGGDMGDGHSTVAPQMTYTEEIWADVIDEDKIRLVLSQFVDDILPFAVSFWEYSRSLIQHHGGYQEAYFDTESEMLLALRDNEFRGIGYVQDEELDEVVELDTWQVSRRMKKVENLKKEKAKIYCTSREDSFALLRNGKVTTWGRYNPGQKNTELLSEGIIKIMTTQSSFLALREDRRVVVWGDPNTGGVMDAETTRLVGQDVVNIFSTEFAFAVLKRNHSVVSWGMEHRGGKCKQKASLASHVVNVFSNDWAFAALKKDGSVVTWGRITSGGKAYRRQELLEKEVAHIVTTKGAFAALKLDGSVVPWGDRDFGGYGESVLDQLQGDVVNIFANDFAFAALKHSGDVVTWGARWAGGDMSHMMCVYSNHQEYWANKSQQNSGSVAQITAVGASQFEAVKYDGSRWQWGFKKEEHHDEMDDDDYFAEKYI